MVPVHSSCELMECKQQSLKLRNKAYVLSGGVKTSLSTLHPTLTPDTAWPSDSVHCHNCVTQKKIVQRTCM